MTVQSPFIPTTQSPFTSSMHMTNANVVMHVIERRVHELDIGVESNFMPTRAAHDHTMRKLIERYNSHSDNDFRKRIVECNAYDVCMSTFGFTGSITLHDLRALAQTARCHVNTRARCLATVLLYDAATLLVNDTIDSWRDSRVSNPLANEPTPEYIPWGSVAIDGVVIDVSTYVTNSRVDATSARAVCAEATCARRLA